MCSYFKKPFSSLLVHFHQFYRRNHQRCTRKKDRDFFPPCYFARYFRYPTGDNRPISANDLQPPQPAQPFFPPLPFPSLHYASHIRQDDQTKICDAHHKAAGRRCLAPRTRRSGFGAAELESHLSSTNNHGLRGYRGYGFTNSSCNTRRKEGDDPGSAIRDAEGYLQACKSGRFPKAEP